MTNKEKQELALGLRGEVGSGPFDPFDPYALATCYGVGVVRLSELSGPARDHFFVRDGSALSGMTIPVGTGRIIIENDAQRATRCKTTMCHELSHIILEHQFGVAIADGRKCGLGKLQEAEADLLAGELLIPFKAALAMARWGASDQDVAERFQVSLAVARWRMNGSGARKIARRIQAKRRSYAALGR